MPVVFKLKKINILNTIGVCIKPLNGIDKNLFSSRV